MKKLRSEKAKYLAQSPAAHLTGGIGDSADLKDHVLFRTSGSLVPGI